MANFQTHITTSTFLGVGYGAVGFWYGLPLDTCLVGAGLCSVAGMLPDLDSDSGIPLRETLSFTAAAIPMLMIDRFQQLGLNHEQMAMSAGLIYVFVRFGVGSLFKRFTVHRGMWHSIPAAFIAAGLGYLICACPDMRLRVFKAAAVFLGFMSHLVLDELWSIETRRGRVRVKRSFGTALKFFSTKHTLSNVTTYAKLLVVGALIFGDPMLMERFGTHDHIPHQAKNVVTDLIEQGKQLLR